MYSLPSIKYWKKVSDISDICQGLSIKAAISDLQFNTEFMTLTENIQPTIFVLVDKASHKK